MMSGANFQIGLRQGGCDSKFKKWFFTTWFCMHESIHAAEIKKAKREAIELKARSNGIKCPESNHTRIFLGIHR